MAQKNDIEKYIEEHAENVRGVNPAFFESAVPPPEEGRSSKYGNQKSEGCDSKKEARRLTELRLLEATGAITDLRTQVRFHIKVTSEWFRDGLHVCDYVADATYRRDGRLVVEDTKSEPTRKNRAYRIKKKLMLAVHGVEIQEV